LKEKIAMRRMVRIACLLVPVVLCAAGCRQNSNLVSQQQTAWQQQQLSQVEEFRRRTTGLDMDNRDLHAQIAQSQQQMGLLRDEVNLLRRRLGDTASQLETARLEKQEADKRISVLEASIRHRGGARITANSSFQHGSLSPINLPGLNVRQDGDVVRIELPSDRLFLPGTATLHQGAFAMIDQAATAIIRTYPQQKIAVEGHTDNRMTARGLAGGSHQLSVNQAMAVFTQLTQRHRFAPGSLFVIGHGAAHPVLSNATPSGQARNRRVEIVIYPEKVGA